MFFKVASPVCSRLHFNLIKHFTQKTFIFKNVVFAFLTKKKTTKKNKNREAQENFSKTPLNFCPCKCTNLGKKTFQYHQRILRKMRLKTFAYNFEHVYAKSGFSHNMASVVGPEGVQGVRSNPPLRPNYLISMDNFKKNYAKSRKRNPQCEFEPPLQKSGIRPWWLIY